MTLRAFAKLRIESSLREFRNALRDGLQAPHRLQRSTAASWARFRENLSYLIAKKRVSIESEHRKWMPAFAGMTNVFVCSMATITIHSLIRHGHGATA